MGNIITAGSPLLTAVTTDGSFDNKVSAADEQFVNNVATDVKLLGTVAGGTAAVALANKYAPVKDVMVKTIDKTAKVTGKGLAKLLPSLKPGLKKIGQSFAKLPGMAKVIGAVGLAAGVVGEYIIRQHHYNQGRIDTRHEISAQKEKNMAILKKFAKID